MSDLALAILIAAAGFVVFVAVPDYLQYKRHKRSAPLPPPTLQPGSCASPVEPSGEPDGVLQPMLQDLADEARQTLEDCYQAYVETFGTTEGWHGDSGNYFIAGYRAGKLDKGTVGSWWEQRKAKAMHDSYHNRP